MGRQPHQPVLATLSKDDSADGCVWPLTQLCIAFLCPKINGEDNGRALCNAEERMPSVMWQVPQEDD